MNPNLVVAVDTSLAVKWVWPEDDSDTALALLERWTVEGIQPIAPSWFACETANVLFQAVRAGIVDLAAARVQLRLLLGVVRLLDDTGSDAERAMEIASLAGQRASYDAQYAALAERLGCELWTADDRFRDAVKPVFAGVHSLSEFRLSR